jgi:flotillin
MFHIVAGVVIGIIVFYFSIMILFVSRYKKCPTDRLMVVFGKTPGDKSARYYHGGAAFVWPFIQDYGYLSLRPLQFKLELDEKMRDSAVSSAIPGIFTIAISTEPGIMENAMTRLFGQFPNAIIDLAKGVVINQLRLVFASMPEEQIKADPQSFLRQFEQKVTKELNNIGLELLNTNLSDGEKAVSAEKTE